MTKIKINARILAVDVVSVPVNGRTEISPFQEEELRYIPVTSSIRPVLETRTLLARMMTEMALVWADINILTPVEDKSLIKVDAFD